MIINDLDDYYIVFDTKNRNTELDTLINKFLILNYISTSRKHMMHKKCILKSGMMIMLVLRTQTYITRRQIQK